MSITKVELKTFTVFKYVTLRYRAEVVAYFPEHATSDASMLEDEAWSKDSEYYVQSSITVKDFDE